MVEPFCLGLCLLKKTLKKFCAKFPLQFPFGIVREDSHVTSMADMENSAALAEFNNEARLEPFCLGLCKLTYKVLWFATKPICKWVPPGK